MILESAVLVLNSGSSSVKFAVYRAEARPTPASLLCSGQVERIGHKPGFTARDSSGQSLAEQRLSPDADHQDALEGILDWIGSAFPGLELAVAGHRVVHGGTRHSTPVRLDAKVREYLAHLSPLAPLHQPHNLEAIDALARLDPALPQVACFDTAFHRTQPPVAEAFALPRSLSQEGVKRYGFHGLSYEYIASAVPRVCGSEVAAGRVVVAHLGHGASMCGMLGGRSVVTTMGFTALDGLPMGRRCGNLDPGVVLYLMQQKGLSAEEVGTLLYQSSGLFGVSGISDDMRELLASSAPEAVEAVELFVYRILRELGSLAAALGGLDALIFTAGIGENAPEIRQRVIDGARWLGFELDPKANARGGPRISAPECRASPWVIPTDEDLMIARHAWALEVAGSKDREQSQ